MKRATEYHFYGMNHYTARRARVEHVCEAGCGSPIHPGEAYWSVSCLTDGRWSTIALHAACRKLGADLVPDGELFLFNQIAVSAADEGYAWDAAAHTWQQRETP